MVSREIATEDAFDAAWRRSYQAKRYIARPLYPLPDAKRDHRLLLRTILQFLHNYGYWPAVVELTQALGYGADYAAVVVGCRNLANMGLTELMRKRYGVRQVRLAQRGWDALGLKPIEPWIVRPRLLLARIANKVTIDLFDLQRAQEQLDARHGTTIAQKTGAPVTRGGQRADGTTRYVLKPGKRDPVYDPDLPPHVAAAPPSPDVSRAAAPWAIDEQAASLYDGADGG